MELRINKSLVTHIKIYDQEESGYIWCNAVPERRIFFNLITTDYGWGAAYWWRGRQGSFNDKLFKLKSNMIDINGVVYFIPHITIFAGNEKLKTKYFETIEEARKYCTDNFPNVKQI